MQITALVPIKTHSERLPNKNFLDFNGQPLYSYVLKTLESIDHIDEIVVNTDSEEIEQFVKNSLTKGRAIQRPDHLLGDHITMNRLIAHDLDHTNGELFLQTHVTNPLLSETTIVKAIEQFTLNENIDSLLGVTPVKKRVYDQKLQPINHNNEALLMTQDLPEILIENSNLFLFSRSSFGATQSRIGENPGAFIMHEIEAIDIDYAHEFQLAQLIHKNQHLFHPLHA